MIHFFPTFSADADNSPLGQELRRIGRPYRIFGGDVRLEYRKRIFILLIGYPKLMWFALRSAWRSMVRSKPRPDAVVLGSDVEVLVFAAVRLALPSPRPRIAFQGFIYTTRPNAWLNRLRQIYYGFVLARCACIICHSRLEITRYRALFPRSAEQFTYVPWGANVDGHERVTLTENGGPPTRVLSAGRSGRDYATLARAIEETGLEAIVICDTTEGLGGVTESSQLQIRRNCYGRDYLAELRRADIVALPLAVDDISAGQMVMIQAMAFAKPLVVTRTPTIDDYITDDVEGLLVDRGDWSGLRNALIKLRNDPELCRRLGHAGRNAYLTRFSQGVMLQAVLDAVGAPPKSEKNSPPKNLPPKNLSL